MGCPFEIGDDVEHFRDNPGAARRPHPPIGHIGRVAEIGECDGDFWIELDNWPHDPDFGLSVLEYRKVERRNDRLSIEAFMTMPGGFEEPRRPKAPARKRERVQ